MYKTVAGLAVVCALSACSTATTTQDSATIANEMPEYRTGSIIAKKKTALSDGVKTMTAEQLEEVRQNSAIQR
jgi:hypothetical protein